MYMIKFTLATSFDVHVNLMHIYDICGEGKISMKSRWIVILNCSLLWKPNALKGIMKLTVTSTYLWHLCVVRLYMHTIYVYSNTSLKGIYLSFSNKLIFSYRIVSLIKIEQACLHFTHFFQILQDVFFRYFHVNVFPMPNFWVGRPTHPRGFKFLQVCSFGYQILLGRVSVVKEGKFTINGLYTTQMTKKHSTC